MDEHIYPNEHALHVQHEQLTKKAGHPWVVLPLIEQLKVKAKAKSVC
jgi:hypothetical protein